MFFGLFTSQVFDIAWPADSRHAVRESLVNHRIESFIETACRAIIITHAAFFTHHRAFRIELAEHCILHTVGFEPQEQFNLVLGECHRICSQQVTCKGIEASATGSLIGAPQFILDKDFAVFVQHGIVFRRKLFHEGGIISNSCRTD